MTTLYSISELANDYVAFTCSFEQIIVKLDKLTFGWARCGDPNCGIEFHYGAILDGKMIETSDVDLQRIYGIIGIEALTPPRPKSKVGKGLN